MQNGFLYLKREDWAIFWAIMAKKGQKWVRKWGLVKLANQICPEMKIQFDNDFELKNTWILSYFKKKLALLIFGLKFGISKFGPTLIGPISL